MPDFSFRLWTHSADDGLLPEVVVTADTCIHAAALALRHFVAKQRPCSASSYLQCDPDGGEHIRVRDVLDWLASPAGREATDAGTLLIDICPGLCDDEPPHSHFVDT